MGVEDTLLLESDYLPDSSQDFGWYGRPNRLMEGFRAARRKAEDVLREADCTFLEAQRSQDEDLREAGSTSDFATYLNDKVSKRLMWSYREQPSSWRAYSRLYNVPDFKPINFTRLTEMEYLQQVPEGGQYVDSQINQIIGPSLTVIKFGRLFTISLEAIVNDDLGQLRDRPAAMGRAAARTLGHTIVNNLIANPLAYDGVSLFNAAHNNLLAGASFAFSEDTVGQAVTLLRQQTDPNLNVIGLRAFSLVVPSTQELTMDRILNSTMVPEPQGAIGSPLYGTVGTQFGRGDRNVMQRIARPVVEDYLTSAHAWYLFADPEEAPVVAVGFLNGRQIPDIFLKDPGMRNVLGGSDPYSDMWDEIMWKIRFFFGAGIYDWRGCVAALVP